MHDLSSAVLRRIESFLAPCHGVDQKFRPHMAARRQLQKFLPSPTTWKLSVLDFHRPQTWEQSILLFYQKYNAEKANPVHVRRLLTKPKYANRQMLLLAQLARKYRVSQEDGQGYLPVELLVAHQDAINIFQKRRSELRGGEAGAVAGAGVRGAASSGTAAAAGAGTDGGDATSTSGKRPASGKPDVDLAAKKKAKKS